MPPAPLVPPAPPVPPRPSTPVTPEAAGAAAEDAASSIGTADSAIRARLHVLTAGKVGGSIAHRAHRPGCVRELRVCLRGRLGHADSCVGGSLSFVDGCRS